MEPGGGAGYSSTRPDIRSSQKTAMPDFRIGSGPFFDRGIDRITFKSGETLQGLPPQRELTPADHAERPRLERLLALPQLDAFLDEAVRPELADRELLLPTRFRKALDGARGALAQAAQARQESDPAAARTLNRAVRLLGDEAGLHDLIAMYRSVLYQG